jgi:hypothetical protein
MNSARRYIGLFHYGQVDLTPEPTSQIALILNDLHGMPAKFDQPHLR